MKEYLGTKEWVKVYCIGAHVFQNFRGHLQILGAGQVTWSKFRTEDSQILGTVVRNMLFILHTKSSPFHLCNLGLLLDEYL